MLIRHSLTHPVRVAVAALAFSFAVIAPATASAYTRGDAVNLLSATCYGTTATFTWDTGWGKPSKWTIANSGTTLSGRFSKAELADGQKSVTLDCSQGGWDLYVSSGRNGGSIGFVY